MKNGEWRRANAEGAGAFVAWTSEIVMFQVNRNPSESDLRKFGRAMLIGFGVIGVVLWIAGARRAGAQVSAWTGSGAQVAAIVLASLGAALFALSRASRSMTKTVYIGWMTVTVPVGIVMSTILLTVLFMLILPVFSLIVRMGDPLRRKLGGTTYWEDYKAHEPTLERMRRPF
jgi:hypothetical protein